VGRQLTRISVWRCDKCTWFRAKHDGIVWENTRIDHPIYGDISLNALFILDVAAHNCAETAKARIRHGIDPHVKYDGRMRVDRNENGYDS
jgi:hypothetical protein